MGERSGRLHVDCARAADPKRRGLGGQLRLLGPAHGEGVRGEGGGRGWGTCGAAGLLWRLRRAGGDRKIVIDR